MPNPHSASRPADDDATAADPHAVRGAGGLSRKRAALLTTLGLAAAAGSAGAAVEAESGPPWAADAAVIEREKAKRPAFVFREEGVPAYTLPDPLTPDAERADGSPSWAARRGVLLQSFREEMYGERPRDLPAMTFRVVEKRERVQESAATLLRVRAETTGAGGTFGFTFVLAIPERPAADAAAPGAVLLIDHRPAGALASLDGLNGTFWPIDRIVASGRVAAAVCAVEVDPDRKDGHADGIRGFVNRGEPQGDRDWRMLSAWGWGAGVVADFLIEGGHADPARLAVVGQSRGGKAALWAAAEDTRFDAVYANGSGSAGAALSRRRFGETIGEITGRFPHWYAPAFAAYEGREAELPFDQHTLISLIAPRGVYVSSAAEDLWGDPRGEYLAVMNAASVYEHLGVEAMAAPEPPPLGVPRIRGATGYHIRPGGHDVEESDWIRFLSFLDHRWGAVHRPALAP